VTRLKAEETSSTKTIQMLRDDLHQEACKAAGLEGRVSALEQDLLHQHQVTTPHFQKPMLNSFVSFATEFGW
jgi:hypothetical protein